MFLPLKWENDILHVLDQNKLPETTEYVHCLNEQDVWDAIKTMKVRGAPAIGITAGFGVVLAVKGKRGQPYEEQKKMVLQTIDYLATSRPTAVNLFWALKKMEKVLARADEETLYELLVAEASEILEEDTRICKEIGMHGSEIIKSGDTIITHCNAGGLATGGYGTALGVMYSAMEKGKKISVFADETRPKLQGARLTVWELMQAGIDVTLICDNMAGYVMKQGRIDVVIVGADRIAANGDTANKIGTYSLAQLAKAHNVPFYVAAPISTIDFAIPDGDHIPIEERNAGEVREIYGVRIAPAGAKVYNPAFDVTPAELITGIITEKGILRSPYLESIKKIGRIVLR